MQHKHYHLIQKWIQDPTGYEVFCRPSPQSEWMKEGCPIWFESFEYKIEPTKPAGFIWHIITDPYNLQIVSQVVTRRDLEALEFVQELYPDCEIRKADKAHHYEVVGLCHIQVCNSVPLKSDELKVLQDLNICSL